MMRVASGCASLTVALWCRLLPLPFRPSQEHQSVDWFGIHEKICQLLGALRTLRPTLGSEDERQRRNLTVQMSQHALIDLTKVTNSNKTAAGMGGDCGRVAPIGTDQLTLCSALLRLRHNFSSSPHRTRRRSTW